MSPVWVLPLFYFWTNNPSRCFSLCLYTSFILLSDLIAVPLSLLLCFYSAVYRIRIRCPCPCLPSWVVLRCLYDCYTFLAYPVEEDIFLAVRMLYGCFLFLSSAFFVFVFVSCFCFVLFFAGGLSVTTFDVVTIYRSSQQTR